MAASANPYQELLEVLKNCPTEPIRDERWYVVDGSFEPELERLAAKFQTGHQRSLERIVIDNKRLIQRQQYPVLFDKLSMARHVSPTAVLDPAVLKETDFTLVPADVWKKIEAAKRIVEIDIAIPRNTYYSLNASRFKVDVSPPAVRILAPGGTERHRLQMVAFGRDIPADFLTKSGQSRNLLPNTKYNVVLDLDGVTTKINCVPRNHSVGSILQTLKKEYELPMDGDLEVELLDKNLFLATDEHMDSAEAPMWYPLVHTDEESEDDGAGASYYSLPLTPMYHRVSLSNYLDDRNDPVVLIPTADVIVGFAIKPYEIPSAKRSIAYNLNNGGLSGFRNLGNTCFMNAALQCLTHTLPLSDYYLSGKFRQDLNIANPLGMKGHLAESYANFLIEIWADKGAKAVVTPRILKDVIGKFAPNFQGYAQQDSQELIAFLLDGLHEDCNRIREKPYVEQLEGSKGCDEAKLAEQAWKGHKSRNDSIIVDLFQGQFRSRLECPQCKHVSTTFDPYLFCSLPIPQYQRLATRVTLYVNDPSVPCRPFTFPIEIVYRREVLAQSTFPLRLGQILEQERDQIVKNVNNQIHRIVTEVRLLPASGEEEEPAPAPMEEPKPPAFDEYEDEDPISFPKQRSPPPVGHLGPLRELYRVVFAACDGYFPEIQHWVSLPRSPSTGHSLKRAFSTDTKKINNDENSSTPSPRHINEEGAGSIDVVVAQDNSVDYEAFIAAVWTPPRREAEAAPTLLVSTRVQEFPHLNCSWLSNTHSVEGTLSEFFKQVVREMSVQLCFAFEQPDRSEQLYTILEKLDMAFVLSTVTNEEAQKIEIWWTGEDQSLRLANEKEPLNKMTKQKAFEAFGWTQRQCNARLVIDLQWPADVAAHIANEVGVNNESVTLPFVTNSIDIPRIVPLPVLEKLFPESLATFLKQYKGQETFESPFAVRDSRYSGRYGAYGRYDSYTVEKFAYVSRLSEPEISLMDCFEEFTSAEILGDDNKWYCPRCKDHFRALKKLDLWRVPDVLVLHLKRFKVGFYGGRTKSDRLVTYPTSLDLSNIVLPKGADQQQAESHGMSRSVYQLQGIVNHFGTMGGGHYTAKCRCVVNGKNEWYRFDDSCVESVSSSGLVDQSAYVLFYQRISGVNRSP